MKLKPKFIQCSCVEGNNIDLRRAKAVLKHKPDIIIFEMPQGNRGPGMIFNQYLCSNKPISEVNKIIKENRIAAKKFPYVASDIAIWKNIEKLWKQGINTQVYNVDSPAKIRRESFYLFNKPISDGYPAVRRDWLFWVHLYLREIYMAKNIKIILNSYHLKKDPVILIFIEVIHWSHVKFLLTNPTKEKIWKYYFGKFKNLKSNKNIENQIKERSTVLNYYWRKIQKFY